MTCERAISLYEQHNLANRSADEGRDWLEEMEMNVEFDEHVLDDLVATGAAVDHTDAHDLLSTEMLKAKQPHREGELAKGFADRHRRRMNADRRAKGAVT